MSGRTRRAKPPMRISDVQRQTILREVAMLLGPETSVWLFGSRASDTARGGDIDLYAEAGAPVPPRLKARLVARLEQQLANHVDLVIREPGALDAPIFRIARETGVALGMMKTQDPCATNPPSRPV